jgi:FAD/FMN-containing dehydrogenase
VTRAVQVCKEAGIRVYAIGAGSHLGGSLESQYGSGNWEVIGTVAELPQAVARLVKRLESFQR